MWKVYYFVVKSCKNVLFFVYFCSMKKIVRVLFLLLNILAVVLLLLSSMSSFVPPSKSAYISLLSYGYFYFLLLNILFLLVWLFFRRKEFLISLAAILLRFSFIPLFVQFGGTQDLADAEQYDKENATVVRLLSFNTHGFHGPNDSLQADSGARKFVRFVREYHPDVMCLQEFFPPAQVKVIDSLELLGYKYHRRTSGSVIFSRFPFDFVGETGSSTKLLVDIAVNSRIFRLFCVHLTSYQMAGSDAETLERLVHGTVDSATELTAKKLVHAERMHESEWNEVLLPQIKESPHPVVVAGDFNDPPSSHLYQQTRKLLKDSFVEEGSGFGTTYHGPFPAFRIDYVLHSDTVKALTYNRIKSDISDHYPLVVDLML